MFVPNTGGSARAWRLFLAFVFVLAVSYLAFAAGSLLGPTGQSSSLPGELGLLSIVALAMAAVGWWITVARAPRAARRLGRDLLVRERLGRVRRFRLGEQFRTTSSQPRPAGLLGPEATELVTLISGAGPARTYLVTLGFFEPMIAPDTPAVG